MNCILTARFVDYDHQHSLVFSAENDAAARDAARRHAAALSDIGEISSLRVAELVIGPIDADGVGLTSADRLLFEI